MAREDTVDRLMAGMTLDEKIGQLNLITPGGASATGAIINENVDQKIRDGAVGGVFGIASAATLQAYQTLATTKSRLKVPLLFAMDVIHGHRTIFPIPLGLSCTWDMELVERTARVAATEAAAEGIRQAYAPMIDVGRDPRWGRIAECPGEDPLLASQFAVAMVRGYQGLDLKAVDSVMACIKHFAAYGACEGGREYANADVSPRRMHDVYLAPFRAGVKAGAGSLMAAFNAVNGRPMHANRELLTEVLRDIWGFDGFVVSDYTGISEMIDHGLGDLQAVSVAALRAGVDQDMVSEGYLATLKRSLDEGLVSMEDIDNACRRILVAKERLGLFDDPFRYLDSRRAAAVVLTPAHRQLARLAAARSCVLLKNEGVLPLTRTGTVAVVGPLADDHHNMLGTWAVCGDHDASVSVLAGMQSVGGPGVTVTYARGANIEDDPEFAHRLNVHGETVTIDPRPLDDLIAEAVAVAAAADVVVAVVGEAREATGECSSRTSLRLGAGQKRLLGALKATGKPLAIVVMAGRPLCLGDELSMADALLLAWFGGTEAGNGFADVLFGEVNPAGRLTTTLPRTEGQIPVYHAMEPTGRPYTGPAEGFAKFRSVYLDCPNEGLFPFGYGQGYAPFHLGPARLDKTDLLGDEDTLTLSAVLTNEGTVAGSEVVQLYLGDPVASLAQPIKRLIDYRKVDLEPGQSCDVTFTVTTESLRFHHAESLTRFTWDWEPGAFIIHIGLNARDTTPTTITWRR